jgi:hypothetical protein
MSETAAIPRTIFIIRHGEKPADPPPPNGVDADGNVDDHSLAPVGWQRAGALAGLFAPFAGCRRPGILTPGKLYSPGYGSAQKTAAERTYETIFPLSQLLDLTIDNKYVESKSEEPEPAPAEPQSAGLDDPDAPGSHPAAPSEAELGADVAAKTTGVTLICWEHTAIAEIANAIVPVAAGTAIPQTWPDARYDVVWSFARPAGSSSDPYVFCQIPQMLLWGDLDTPIPT